MFNIKMSTISESIPERRIPEESECTSQPRERSDTEEMMERVEEIMNNTR